MFAGILLFFMQMHGYSHHVFVDDLAFSKDAHYHVHKEMESQAQRIKDLSLPDEHTNPQKPVGSNLEEANILNNETQPHSHEDGLAHTH